MTHERRPGKPASPTVWRLDVAINQKAKLMQVKLYTPSSSPSPLLLLPHQWRSSAEAERVRWSESVIVIVTSARFYSSSLLTCFARVVFALLPCTEHRLQQTPVPRPKRKRTIRLRKAKIAGGQVSNNECMYEKFKLDSGCHEPFPPLHPHWRGERDHWVNNNPKIKPVLCATMPHQCCATFRSAFIAIVVVVVATSLHPTFGEFSLHTVSTLVSPFSAGGPHVSCAGGPSRGS